MSKEEKIKEAYGEFWNEVKDYVDENGFIWQSTLFFPETKMKDKFEIQVKGFDPDGRCKWRPKSLQGIENNNGWIRIESESDLPKKDIDCHIIFSDGKIRCDRFLINYKNFITSHYKNITYYQPIIKPQPPIH